MKILNNISLITLIGLVLPFGNIWGPFLVSVPKDSPGDRFRRRLVLLEILLTFIFFTIAIVLMAKSMNADFNVSLFVKAMKVFIIESVVIIAIALTAPYLLKTK